MSRSGGWQHPLKTLQKGYYILDLFWRKLMTDLIFAHDTHCLFKFVYSTIMICQPFLVQRIKQIL